MIVDRNVQSVALRRRADGGCESDCGRQGER